MGQVITDFFDQMKSRSKGYASMEYQLTGYRENDLVRLDILIAQARSHTTIYSSTQ
jgi:GTP-binding protein LepA